jgi:gamma-glutamyltranspeptidase / glutathione hydrolase
VNEGRRLRSRSQAAVASPHSAATDVGREVLERGGNAFDAAIAMNAMLVVASPHMCGIGGDLFLLAFDARAETVSALNASGPAPAQADVEQLRARGHTAVPVRGPLSVTVPGAVAGWEETLRRFGSMPLADLLEPAIAAAGDGVEVTSRLARWIADTRDDLAADPVLSRRMLTPDGRPLAAAATLRQPELARALSRLAEAGGDDLYAGALGAEIARATRAAGGLLDDADLAGYAPRWETPLRVSYRGLEICTTPPNSQGITSLLMLNALAELGVESLRPGGPEHLEAFIAAKRSAFADRDRYVADPDFVEVPVERLLDPGHARTALARVPVESAPTTIGGDTVYLCAVDCEGNACSAIQSIYYGFGSCFVAGDSGVLLHNRGHYFSLDERHPNRLEPGKRPLHTLMACIALEDGRPWLVFGTMGADGQPQTNVQVLERVLAGCGPQEAVSSPRVLHGRFVLEDDPDLLHVEPDLGAEVISALRDAGHRVQVADGYDERMGHAHAIRVDGDTLSAGSDPRSDGSSTVLNLRR